MAEKSEGAGGRGALAGLALCMLLPSLGVSIANVALPTLTQAFGAAIPQAQWVVLAYLLATTTLVVGAGRLADRLGRRRLLLAGVALFTAASGLCALAQGLGQLVAARALQGVGAAVLMALPLALVGDAVPKAAAGRAMGLLGTMSAVGTALGPSLGGLLIAAFGWRAIFVAGLPIGALAGVLAWRGLPADRPTAAAGASLDPAGMGLLALVLGAYALALTLGRGHPGVLNAALLGVAGLGLGLLGWVERRVAAPLLALSPLRERGTGLALNALVATVMMATLVVGPFYLAQGLGLDAVGVGLAMSAGPVVSALGGVPAGRLVDRFGPALCLQAGLAGMAAGFALLCLLPLRWGVLAYVLPLAGLTASYALAQAANNTAVMAGVPAPQRGVVAGLLTLARNLGFITGAALMAALFSGMGGPVAGLRACYALALGLMLVALGLAGRSYFAASTSARMSSG